MTHRFGSLQLNGPQTLGSVFIIQLCTFSSVVCGIFRDEEYSVSIGLRQNRYSLPGPLAIQRESSKVTVATVSEKSGKNYFFESQ